VSRQKRYRRRGWVIFPNIPLPMIIRFKKTINEMNKYDFIWLPTQEQLQEMIKKRHIYYLIKDFQIFQVKYTVGLHINDMNELWLAFVMKEKYHKIWTGEKWVKAE